MRDKTHRQGPVFNETFKQTEIGEGGKMVSIRKEDIEAVTTQPSIGETGRDNGAATREEKEEERIA